MFHVGDIVTGKPNNGYGITNENMTRGEVVSISSSGKSMRVKILEYNIRCGSEVVGGIYSVDSKSFELVEPEPKITITADELRAILNVR